MCYLTFAFLGVSAYGWIYYGFIARLQLHNLYSLSMLPNKNETVMASDGNIMVLLQLFTHGNVTEEILY